MIRQIRFRNYKVLKDLDIDLEPLTVFVGPNGCGKSSVLEGLEDLLELTVRRSREFKHDLGRVGLYFVEPRELSRLATNGADQLKIGISSAAVEELSLTASKLLGSAADLRISLFLHAQERQLTLQVPPHERREASSLYDALSQIPFGPFMRLTLELSKLRQPSYSEDQVPSVDHSGGNLAATIANLTLTDRGQVDRIVSDLRRVIPRARSLRTPRAKVLKFKPEQLQLGDRLITQPVRQELWGHSLELELEGQGFVPASLLSEGTLIALALLTVIHGPNRPRLLLIDDLQRGLHPTAEAELVKVLKDVMAANPELQILCTTHSPYLIDHFEPEEVRVMGLGPDGDAICKPLTAHPDWPKWRGLMEAGEFWSTVGEDWLAQAPEGAEATG